MTPAEYAAFVREVRAFHDDEEAARIIEAACHPEYKPPLRIDLGQARAAARREAAEAEGGAA